jgi:hypothetical protein
MPSRTKAQLGRELPDQICVVQSQFSIAQTRNAVQTLSALAKDNSNGILAISPGQTTAGQPEVSLEAVKATGTIQRTISNLPSGLVRQSYWLTVRPGQ